MSPDLEPCAGVSVPRPGGSWIRGFTAAVLGRREAILARSLWVAAFLPWVVVVSLAWRYAVNVPVWDAWSQTAGLLARHADGSLELFDFWRQEVGGRMLFPRLLTFTLARVSGWNTHWEIVASLAMNAVILAGCLCLARREGGGPVRTPLAALLLAAVMLHPMQSMNWVYPPMVVYFLVTMPALVVIAAFRCPWPIAVRLPIAMAAATVSAYSYLPGWLSWCVLFLLLASEFPVLKPRARWGWGILAAGVFLAALAGYAHGFSVEGAGMGETRIPFSTYLRGAPFEVGRFLFTLLGAAWACLPGIPGEIAAPLAGMAGCVLFAAVLWIRRSEFSADSSRGRLVSWIAFCSFGLGCAAMVTIGRCQAGLYPAFWPRYLAFTLWFWAGLMMLWAPVLAACLAKSSPGLRCVGMVGLCALFATGYASGVRWGLAEMERIYLGSLQLKAALHAFVIAPDSRSAALLWPGHYSQLKRLALKLDGLGYLGHGLFQNPVMADLPVDRSGRVQGRLESAEVKTHGYLVGEAWAFDSKRRRPVDAVFFSVENATQVERIWAIANHRIRRDGLARKLNYNGLGHKLGWSRELARNEPGIGLLRIGKRLGAGRHTVRAYAYDTETGTFFPLEGERTVVVPENPNP